MTGTSGPISTPSSTPTPTTTPIGTHTFTPTATPTRTNTPTASRTPTTTATSSRTNTPTNTLTPSPTFTPSVTPTPLPTYFVEAVEDAYVDSATPNTNFGAANRLNVVGGGGSTQVSYLRFKVTGIPYGVQRATLRLFVTDGTTGTSSVYMVPNTYKNSVNDWLENGLTWNNAPAITTPPLASITGATAGSWLEYDVSAAWIFPEGDYSFAIINNSGDLLSFELFEGGRNLPQLVIEPASLPPPPPTIFVRSPTPTATPVIFGVGLVQGETVTPSPDVLLELNVSPVVRSAGWIGQVVPVGASGGSYLVNTLADDLLKLTFSGTSVEVVYVQGPTLGTLRVEIDGAIRQEIDTAAPTYTFGAHFTVGGLAEGTHELRLTAAEGSVGIDAFVIHGADSGDIAPAPIEVPTITPSAPPIPTASLTPTNTLQPPEVETETPPVLFKRE